MLNIQQTLHAQLDAASVLAHQAFESAEKLAALQVQAARARIERSADTLRKLYVDGKATHLADIDFSPELEHLTAFSRSLIDISAGAQLALLRLTNRALAELPAGWHVAPAAKAPAKAGAKVEAIEAAPEVPAAPAPVAAPVEAAPEAVPVQVKTSKPRTAKPKAQGEASFPVPSTRTAKAKAGATKNTK